MAKSIISEGKTTNEAIEKGLKQLNVSKKMVDIKVLESEDKRSFSSKSCKSRDDTKRKRGRRNTNKTNKT